MNLLKQIMLVAVEFAVVGAVWVIPLIVWMEWRKAKQWAKEIERARNAKNN